MVVDGLDVGSEVAIPASLMVVEEDSLRLVGKVCATMVLVGRALVDGANGVDKIFLLHVHPFNRIRERHVSLSQLIGLSRRST
jgi:hypothetical protein